MTKYSFTGLLPFALACGQILAQVAGGAGAAAASQTGPRDTGGKSAPPAQTAPAPTAFLAADVQTSPGTRFPSYSGVVLLGDRVILRQATMLDLISSAYVLDRRFIHGGPSWLDWDRFDIVAKVPAGTKVWMVGPMLRGLLEERFGLVVGKGTAPMPAWVLRVEKDKLQKAGAGTGPCRGTSPGAGAGGAPMTGLTCQDKPMASLASTLSNSAGWQFDAPLVDATGLTGGYNFDLNWTPQWALKQAGSDAVTIFDALENQLGLTLKRETAPREVFLVEHVNEKPTPNAPDIAKLLPQRPLPQFEVAVIKPTAPGERGYMRISGDEVNARAIPLRVLIGYAWDLNENDKDQIAGAPKWLDSDRIDLYAKLSDEEHGLRMGKGLPMDPQELREMVRSLLIERFEMKVHMEQQPVDAYDLVTMKPKLTPADPQSRTGCNEGPGPDGKDPRLTHPVLNMLVTCQNVTMAQAGEEFSRIAGGYIFNSVVDKSRLEGGWDFTLSWSSADQMPEFSGHRPAPAEVGTASDPNGALSFYDAVSKELGLKLEKVKRAEPVLVIDHIDEQPTPN